MTFGLVLSILTSPQLCLLKTLPPSQHLSLLATMPISPESPSAFLIGFSASLLTNEVHAGRASGVTFECQDFDIKQDLGSNPSVVTF